MSKKKNLNLGVEPVDVRSLATEFKKLTTEVSNLGEAYRKMLPGNDSFAKQTAAIVSDYHDLLDLVGKQNTLQDQITAKYKRVAAAKAKELQDSKAITSDIGEALEEQLTQLLLSNQTLNDVDDTQNKILNVLDGIDAYNKLDVKAKQSVTEYLHKILELRKQEIADAEALISVQNVTVDLAKIQADKAREIYAAHVKEFKQQQNLLGASDNLVQLTYDRLQLQNKLNAGSKLANEAITDQLRLIDSAIEKQMELDELERSRLAILKQEEVTKNAINSLEEKANSLLGQAGEEILELGHALKASMLSPWALIGALIGSSIGLVKELTEETRNFLNTSKLTVDQTAELAHYAHELSLEYGDQGLEFKDVLNSANALANTYGTLNRVSNKSVENISLMHKAFGISADNATGVVYQMQKTNGLSADAAMNVAALGASFAKAAGVAPDVVFQDMAQSSEAIATYFKGTSAELVRTAVEARRLGLSIQKVADISKALLSFETSIEDQMTASVLMGREINLDKARQLALEGKIQEAAEETMKQVGNLADFNRLNAIQKEAVAKAAGLSVGELQQSLEKQKALNDMTSSQRAEYDKNLALLKAGNEMSGERLLKEQKNQLAQEKLTDAVKRLADVVANVLYPAFEPFLDALGWVASTLGKFPNLIRVIAGGLVLWKVGAIGIKNAFMFIPNTFKGIINGLKSAIAWTKSFTVAKQINTFATKEEAAANAMATGPTATFGAALIEAGTGALMFGAGIALAGAGVWLFAKGLAVIATEVIPAVISGIVELISHVGGIMELSGAFAALAASVAMLGAASLIALPAVGLIAAAGTGLALGAAMSHEEPVSKYAVSNATSTSASESTAESANTDQLIAKMDQLINAINAQPIQIKLDGKIVAESVGRNTGRSFVGTNK